jgi:hypothetical protein
VTLVGGALACNHTCFVGTLALWAFPRLRPLASTGSPLSLETLESLRL